MMTADEGEQKDPCGIFTCCLVRALKGDLKMTPELIVKPFEAEMAKCYPRAGPGESPQRLGLETTSTRLFTETILALGFDPAWDKEADRRKRAVVDQEDGTLTVTPPRHLSRGGLMPWRTKTRHLIVRCGVRAEGGIFADFDVMESAGLVTQR
jgi:hypothetical protein